MSAEFFAGVAVGLFLAAPIFSSRYRDWLLRRPRVGPDDQPDPNLSCEENLERWDRWLKKMMPEDKGGGR